MLRQPQKCIWYIILFYVLVSHLSLAQAGMGRNSTSDELTGRYLATILRAARAAFYDLDTEKMQTNPAAAGLTIEMMEALISKKYVTLTGKKLEYETQGSKMLQKAIRLVLEKAFADGYKDTWANEKFYPNKLLPERFMRELSAKLNEVSVGNYTLRITNLKDCLVNSNNASDDWEKAVITDKFSSKWDKTKGYFENLPNTRTDRYIFPDFYEKRCLNCHGGDAGKELHPVCPNMKLGAFGGALSFLSKY